MIVNYSFLPHLNVFLYPSFTELMELMFPLMSMCSAPPYEHPPPTEFSTMSLLWPFLSLPFLLFHIPSWLLTGPCFSLLDGLLDSPSVPLLVRGARIMGMYEPMMSVCGQMCENIFK